MIKIIIIAMVLFAADAQENNISKNWNLLGATEDLNTSFLRSDCANSTWSYENNSWKNFAHGKEKTTSFSTIAKGKGFWVYSKSGDCSLNTTIETWYRYTVPKVKNNNRIVKKDGIFIALVDPYRPEKVFPLAIQSGPKNGSTLISSIDGITWVEMNVELPGTYISIIETPTYFYAVGLSLNNYKLGSIVRSIDGKVWEEVLVFKRNLSDIAIWNGTLVAVGPYGDIVTSKDGTTWEEKKIDTHQLYSIAYSENELIVSGDIKMLSTKDMEYWISLDTAISQYTAVRNSLFANGLFMLVTYDSTHIFDGNNFRYVERKSNLKEVVYHNKFLSFDENSVSISSDGITWTKLAELKSVDENTTNLNVEKSFISGSDIIFPSN